MGGLCPDSTDAFAAACAKLPGTTLSARKGKVLPAIACCACRELREHLRGHLAPGDRVLVLGCGNSSLAEDLYCDSLGVSHIVSVDISPTVIQHMGAQAAHRGHHELKWQVRQSCNHQIVYQAQAAPIWCATYKACAAALLVDHPAHGMSPGQRRSACVAVSSCIHGNERRVPSPLSLSQAEPGDT